MQGIPTRAQGFLLERIDEDVLLYHPALTKSIRLNDTASMIWELCDGQRSVAAITELLMAAYPDEQDEVTIDVEGVVRRLVDEGALVLR